LKGFFETSLKVRGSSYKLIWIFLLDREIAFLGDSLAAISLANEAAEEILHLSLNLLKWNLELNTELLLVNCME
jgi:hypothetical protein